MLLGVLSCRTSVTMVEKLRDIVHDDQKDSSIQRCLLADAAAAVTSAAAISPIITAADRLVAYQVFLSTHS